MSIFQHHLWGYELTYPDEWIHQSQGPIEAFVSKPAALASDYSGPESGQILVRCEWNSRRQAIEPIWNRHIGMLASWLGARKVGAATWKMGPAAGLETEILLPTKDPRRLWSGILEYKLTVLHFMVLHLKEERHKFEPLATQIISSLRFPLRTAGAQTSPDGLLLPPDCQPLPPQEVIPDISEPDHWRAYAHTADAGALQAFYVREAPNHGWEIDEYIPYPNLPGNETEDLGFSRLAMHQAESHVSVGILPYQEKETQLPSTRLVFKLE